jgi:uncharacterized protein YjiS (DUF1127 family)
MKPLHFAIASIVAANTGFGLHQGSERIDYARAEQEAHSLRSRSFTRFVGRIGEGIAASIARLRRYRDYRRGVNQLAALSDHHLEDIGVNRGDIVSLQLNQIDATELEARRGENRGKIRVQLSKPRDQTKRNVRHAANDAIFASAKCA